MTISLWHTYRRWGPSAASHRKFSVCTSRLEKAERRHRHVLLAIGRSSSLWKEQYTASNRNEAAWHNLLIHSCPSQLAIKLSLRCKSSFKVGVGVKRGQGWVFWGWWLGGGGGRTKIIRYTLHNNNKNLGHDSEAFSRCCFFSPVLNHFKKCLIHVIFSLSLLWNKMFHTQRQTTHKPAFCARNNTP